MTRFCLLILLLGLALPASGFQYWNDIRNSAPLTGGDIVIRVENPSGEGIENQLLWAEGTVLEALLTPVADGAATLTASAPGPVASRRYYGFRLLQGQELDFIPVRLADGAVPVPGDLTRLAVDPVGDEVFGRTHLDLTDCRVSWDGTRLYAALQNAGGGFPVSAGLTFFGYNFGIVNPAESDPDTRFALIYTFDLGGIISPGLFRIESSGGVDLIQIGEVTVAEFAAENTLLLSCDLNDLLADPVFAAWYDPGDPVLGVSGFTQELTFGGAGEADRTPNARCYLRPYAVDAGSNVLPQLSAPFVAEPGPDAYAAVVYSDADAHCPVLAEVVIDDVAYPLFPQSLDYTAPVTYRSAAGIAILVQGNWSQAVFRFSDNEVDVVTAQADNITPVPDGPWGDPRLVQFFGAPNPASGHVAFRLEIPETVPLRLTVHDLAGRTVTVLLDGYLAAGQRVLTWDGRDASGRRQPAGVYFYRLQTPLQDTVRRITLIR